MFTGLIQLVGKLHQADACDYGIACTIANGPSKCLLVYLPLQAFLRRINKAGSPISPGNELINHSRPQSLARNRKALGNSFLVPRIGGGEARDI